MNSLHKRRMSMLGFILAGLALAVGLMLYALRQNINIFLTPSQIAAAHLTEAQHFRLGGLIKAGSIVRDPAGLGVEFIVTDLKNDLRVRYVGVLPDLFREGTGVIAEGQLNKSSLFMANVVLAKHDENYMPKNVYKTIRENAR